MNTKLTLSLDKTVIDKAKSYAKNTGRSLSEIVENYFENLTSKSQDDKEIHPKVKKLIGIITLPDDFDENKARDEYYTEKYGL